MAYTVRIEPIYNIHRYTISTLPETALFSLQIIAITDTHISRSSQKCYKALKC